MRLQPILIAVASSVVAMLVYDWLKSRQLVPTARRVDGWA